MGIFKKFWDWGTETFSDQSKTQTLRDDMTVSYRHYSVSFHPWKGHDCFNVTSLFIDAPLDGSA